MATTSTVTGSWSSAAAFQAALGTDYDGTPRVAIQDTVAFASAGGDAPTIAGFLNGTVTATTTPTDILLAHATDPFQGLGDSTYQPADFNPASDKIKWIRLENEDSTNNVTIARAASNGCPIFDAASDAITLAPGDIVVLYFKAGKAALTTGSNDALTVTASASTVALQVTVAYGP